MKGKCTNPDYLPSAAIATSFWLLLSCWCILLSTTIVSETLALAKVSSLTTLSTEYTFISTPFLQFRAGAFGSNDAADNGDKNKSQTKGKQNTSNINNNITVEEYVAAMRERDAGQDSSAVVDENKNIIEGDVSSHLVEESTRSVTKTTLPSQENDTPIETKESGNEKSSAVGVKSHKKLSNAVGDPDDDDEEISDDDDDDDNDDDDDDDDDDNDNDNDDDENDSQSEYSEEWEEIEETFDQQMDNKMFEPRVELEIEMLEEEEIIDRHVKAKTKGGGGVGVRLGRIANRRRKNRRKTEILKPSYDQTRLLRAWNPFVYFPPTPTALCFLSKNARLFNSSSKNRLDRRTLYAGLLLEWGAIESKLSSGTRKFLPASSSQSLQAALSLATQPQWRQSTPRTSGIRLYNDDESAKGSTLGMQETIAMGLAHSLGCGMLILDDHVINKVRHQMASCGLSNDAMKPAALIRSLLSLATQGKLRADDNPGSISACMKRDLLLGLDDPYDERATISCDDMSTWEEEWKSSPEDELCSKKNSETPLPLLVFIRTNTSTNLLKSKSAMELLIHECASNDSIHLITLGKGIDATTSSLPKEVVQDSQEIKENSPREIEGSAPWSGFSNQNQNASGQNDPEGSRRFNIFLARTIDENGQPGVLGAIAPPQAGNLFPHMMAIQARERIQNQEEDSPGRAELEKWAQALQEHMENNGSADSVMPPPQFFNASLAYSTTEDDGEKSSQSPTPEVIEKVLQQAMSTLLDRMSQTAAENDQSDVSPDLQKAFAQVLRNDNLRRGIADNLARAAPTLSDPKCQGVMLSVYVPPPPQHLNGGQLPGPPNGMQGQQPNNMGGWFQNILSNQEANPQDNTDDDSNKKNKQKRVRTMAAAAAVMAANKANSSKGNDRSSENKAGRNLAKLESICRPIPIGLPQDPVRAKSWEFWISRERGAVIFRQNRKLLNEELTSRNLAIQQYTGTRGAGSALRQLLSVRNISGDIEDTIKCAVELEAAKSLRQGETSQEMHKKEMNLDVDISLSQLMVTEDESVETKDEAFDSVSGIDGKENNAGLQYIHPSNLEMALSMKCHLSPSPSGGLSLSSAPASHRTKDEIMAIAQDKHERALVSQVASPQEIGVTYDMVGGLSNVKELLRQSITYPLKFPHLYSEGIAREAVKGVLLFGPPGMHFNFDMILNVLIILSCD